MIFFARDDVHGVVGNGLLQLEGLGDAIGRLSGIGRHKARYVLVADPPHSLAMGFSGLPHARKGLDA